MPFSQAAAQHLFDAVFTVDRERRVTYWNPAAEKLTGFLADQIVGKSCCEDLLLHITDSNQAVHSGMYPAAETLDDGEPREARIYLRHREGHLLPVLSRCVAIRDEAGCISGVVEILRDDVKSTAAVGSPMPAAFLDPQTQLVTSSYLLGRLTGRFEEMRRYGWKFGVIMAGMDNHEAVIAAAGQEAFEQLMIMAGKTFAHSLRSFDVVGRWNESELLAILPIRQYSDLYAIAERVRYLVQQVCTPTDARACGATLSLGAAGADENDTPEGLLRRATIWMKQSRRAGGNKVTL